ncbi:MAG: bifunctional folylpolyglutamate synthase/dihydrofolate synthase, partial [Coriobacteriales bacterium]|nr:bifunctional folylpolyglutamate synthase/dihydrofolate synthase [Coriobacteriales bacterium]
MDRALSIIRSALTFGINPSLEPMEKICALLGKPEQRFICIQVGGTNGKSSTSRYLAALLRATGHKTGLYTS